jgi:hypothetical protein
VRVYDRFMQQCDDGRRARLGSRADSIRVALEGVDMTFSLKRALCGAMLAASAELKVRFRAA